jgi:3-phenylpropionate/trans-cinnamate dioxygenase ferredoxin reductase component
MLGAPLRLESVQNAVDQARAVARRLTGKPEPYAALPWFWSDQGDLKLQIAGLSHGVDRWVARGDPAMRAFAMFGFRSGKLAVVETVNRGADHMAARRLIAAGAALTPEQVEDPGFDLRKLALAAKT